MGVAPPLAAQPRLQRIDDLGLDPVERCDFGGGRFDRRKVGGRQAALRFDRSCSCLVDVAQSAGGGARAATATDTACWATIQLSLSATPASAARRSASAAAARNAPSPEFACAISWASALGQGRVNRASVDASYHRHARIDVLSGARSKRSRCSRAALNSRARRAR